MKRSRTFSKILDRRAKHLPSDIHDENCTQCKRFLVGLKTQTVKTVSGTFTYRKTLSAALQEMPPEDKLILLSNAPDKDTARSEADQVLVDYVLSEGKKVPGNLYHQEFGETGLQYLTVEQFKDRKTEQRKERHEFFKSLVA